MSQVGFLQVNVCGKNIGMPIDNAIIKVLDRDCVKIIHEARTDSCGQTPFFELPAPPLDYSLGADGKKPYAEYSVIVAADGFEPVTIAGIQVLPEQKAFENISLHYRTMGELKSENILVDEHTLWGAFPAKIMEDEIKPLPNASGYIVLPDPVVPEFIVVHLGTPNSTAKDIWVPFKDYIKNVACCEIYATWPEETIKANILAIISFTLNRVYTEWYRGQGHAFTITNSTAYDHAYHPGQSIFEEISVAVDSLFNTYVTKPHIEQPLFTQYCDGRRTTCEKGMSQWGSKDLGEQGMLAIDILKNYYGYDIYYDAAEKVEGVPLSYGGTVLTEGSSGEDVRVIQHQLNTISNHYPLIPKEREDGLYSSQTTDAVSKFQEIFGLPVTGRVDFAVWYKISDVYVAVMKLSEPL